MLKFLIFALACGLKFGHSLEFHRDSFGVIFSPYVKRGEGDAFGTDPITFEDLTTMLELICTKFSRIIIESVDAEDVLFRTRTNHSYHNSTNARAKIPEAAALVNRVIGKKCLIVTIGIYDADFTYSQQMNTEVHVAAEAAYIANAIFPETVEGFVFSNYEMNNLAWAQSTLYWMKTLRNLTFNSTLKIGTKLFLSNKQDKFQRKSYFLEKVLKELIVELDFVICVSNPTESSANYGANYSFSKLKPFVLNDRSEIRQYSNKTEVMLLTTWNTAGEDEYELDNLREYWKQANDFALRENYTVFLRQAFDTNSNSNGWWKLMQDDLANNISGYLEKVTSPRVASLNAGNNGNPMIKGSTNMIIFVCCAIKVAVCLPFK